MQIARLAMVLIAACSCATAFGQEIEQVFGRRPACPPPCQPLPPCPPNFASPLTPNTNPASPEAMNQNQPESNAFNNALASAGEGGTQPAASYNPAFFGDLLGGFGLKFVAFDDSSRFEYAPINSHSSGYKITDGESPRPMDRIYYNYNEFSYVNFSSNGTPINVQRQVIGLEKTLFDGFMSVGMRIPFVLTDGDPGIATRQFADMTFIVKWGLWNDQKTGNVLSAGLAVTVPTGPQDVLSLPDLFATPYPLDDSILQPFIGYIYNFSPRLYTQGFLAVAVPTDSKDVTILFNDMSFGYWLYRNPSDEFIRGFVPTVEVHVNTPLNHQGKDSLPIGFSELVDMTCGAYLIFPRSTLGGAIGFPMTGPKPYGIEAVAQFTLRF